MCIESARLISNQNNENFKNNEIILQQRCKMCSWGWEDAGTLMHWLVGMEHGAINLENILVVFSQLKYIFVLNDPVIHFLGTFPKEIVIELSKGTYTKIIMIALFVGVGSIWRSLTRRVDM